MTVLIKGMEMPEDCIKCPVCVFEKMHWRCRAGYVADFGGTCRPPKCPLSEVSTPHGRLIDADKLIVDIMDRGVEGIQTDDLHEIQQTIMDAHTVTEAEE